MTTKQKFKLAKTVQLLMDKKIKFNWETRTVQLGKCERLEWIIPSGKEVRLEAAPGLGINMTLDGTIIFQNGTEAVLKAVIDHYPSLTTA